MHLLSKSNDTTELVMKRYNEELMKRTNVGAYTKVMRAADQQYCNCKPFAQTQ